jgi:hypothetical protein
MLGPNPTQERFRLAAYYLTDLSFQASGPEPLAWGEFMEWYTVMYPRGQPGLPDDTVTAYVNNLRATDATPGLQELKGNRPHSSTTHAGVQRLRGLGVKQLRIRASTAPPCRRRPMMGAARRARGGQAPAR